MVKKAVIIRTSADQKRCIAIDSDNYNEIIAFLKADARHKSKFADIANVLLAGHRNTQLYDKEEPDARSKGVRAMKFSKDRRMPVFTAARLQWRTKPL